MKKNEKKNNILFILLIIVIVGIVSFYVVQNKVLKMDNSKITDDGQKSSDYNEDPRPIETDDDKKSSEGDGNKETDLDEHQDEDGQKKEEEKESEKPKEDEQQDKDTEKDVESHDSEQKGETDDKGNTHDTSQGGGSGESGQTEDKSGEGSGGGDDGDTGNWMHITPTQYPQYGQIITEIHFLKLSQEEINSRYNAAIYKDGLPWRGDANCKSWLEGTKLIVASPKTIYLRNNANDYEINYLWNGISFGSNECSPEDDTTCTGQPAGYPNLEVINFENVNTSMMTNMGNMFSGAKKLRRIEHIERLDTRNVVGMQRMFYECESLTELDLTNFDTSKLRSMFEMFRGCKSLTNIKMSSKFNAINVETMYYAFANCPSLLSLDLSSFDTRRVTTMQYMFVGSWNLRTVYVSMKWSTASITYKDQQIFGDSGRNKSPMIGGAGTVCANTSQDATVAHFDVAGNPGCFTFKG